ncbi:PREDICTED: uncharacterized protein LOC106741638 [Dinoponera quadriceps]|uniref:Uncharacterized protein LOC106741638 n=1 Tax=Dinoponera quadriceps TaxID=609295 RepID=A0A6P3WU08_DINQU|nr:PREDICTED: uncharacterized protein LOC106741638 [Dinoponera quadriceps]
MGCEIKELDVKELQRKILCKCQKAEFLAPCYEEEDVCQEEDIEDIKALSMKDDKIVEEELPFEEILADKRRKYTAKEEWEGHFLRKKPSTIHKDDVEIDDNDIGEGEEIDDHFVSDTSLIKEGKDEGEEEAHVLSWRLSLPDEFADINFYNGNSYSGRISRKMMEGEGTYKWHDGVRYKGQFEQNRIQGRGLLGWTDDRWYEGDFVDGLRHGQGILIDKKHSRVHIGQWHTDTHKKV